MSLKRYVFELKVVERVDAVGAAWLRAHFDKDDFDADAWSGHALSTTWAEGVLWAAQAGSLPAKGKETKTK